MWHLLIVPLSLALVGPFAGSSSQVTRSEEITFDSAGVNLAGSVHLPVGEGPFSGVVLIHGSGSSGRDNEWAAGIANALVRHGIAVLNPDKRGSGASGGNWKEAGFEVLSGDAHAAAEVLRRHRGVDPRRVGYVGLSQGGHYAAMTAATDPAAAFVVNVSGSAVTPGEQVVHEVLNNIRQAGAPPQGIEMGGTLIRAANDFVRTSSASDWDKYLSQRELVKRTFGERAVTTFPDSKDDWYWSWWRRVIDFDAVTWWSRLKVPALVVYGEDDEGDNVPVQESVKRLAGTAAAVLVIPGVGHSVARDGTLDPKFISQMVKTISEAPAVTTASVR